jgi:hypothetical protein
MVASFEWDPEKDLANQAKHGVSFLEVQLAFLDPKRVIARDVKHSSDLEERFFCIGRVDEGILTVRFIYRGGIIRLYGAGYWTKGRKTYEQANSVHE